jgi:hypothetical protein
VTVSTNEVSAAAGNIGVTGTVFIPVVVDAWPITNPNYVSVNSINAFVAACGPLTSTSATAYNWLDELFHDGGQLAYITRVTDVTATAAVGTLSDSIPHPSVVVTASPGVFGNGLYVVVTRGTAATFTMTASSTASATAISSFANIGIGTQITGTNVAANTYLTAVNPTAGTATLSSATTGAAGTVTPATFTVTVQDVNGNVFETHGPFATTAQLYADLSSTLVSFSQSAGSGFTANQPAILSATALTGGANANDLTVASNVAALASFGGTLGPGTVAIPGYANATAWAGIASHCAAKNRFGVADLPDNSSSASVISNFGTITANSSYLFPIVGSLTLPGITPGTTRTVAGSALVAALFARVGATSNQVQIPAGVGWPASYPNAFTEYYGPGGSYLGSDVNAMSAAGINCFAVYEGVPCLFGGKTATLLANDSTFWSAGAARERMAITKDATTAIAPFLFDTLDGSNQTYTAAQHALQAVIVSHFTNGALYGDNAADAGQVNMGSPINTPATAAAGQLNANLQVRIPPYADTITETITVVPITVPVS